MEVNQPPHIAPALGLLQARWFEFSHACCSLKYDVKGRISPMLEVV